MLSLKSLVRKPESAADAWLVVGGSPAVWVEALKQAGADLDRCQGYVLPTSLRCRSPSGFLVVAGGVKLPRSSSQPYRCLCEKLWIPLQCGVVSSRARGGDRSHAAAIFHPGIGLVGFEETDRLGVADLLARLVERPTNFSWAHPGLPLQDRLYGITAMAVPRVRFLLDDVGEEIGSQETSGLPEAPDEKSESWRKQMKGRLLNALNRLAKNDDDQESKKGWKQRLEAWSEERLEALRKDQEREMNRLLHLLKSDPDEGLKFGLPLGGGQSGNETPKDAELEKRSPDFQLGKVGRGQPRSPWVLDWRKHYELSREYRETANVLRQGRHYREASVLYLKHLGDPLEGARCLREGGFLVEAIPIFERKKQHETAAELYAALGNDAEAERQYLPGACPWPYDQGSDVVRAVIELSRRGDCVASEELATHG